MVRTLTKLSQWRGEQPQVRDSLQRFFEPRAGRIVQLVEANELAVSFGSNHIPKPILLEKSTQS